VHNGNNDVRMQDALQAESRRTMDALQRLPAALAAALPVTDVQLLPGAGPPYQQQQEPLLGQLSPADKSWLQTALQDALQQAAERVVANQVLLASESSRAMKKLASI
jgi:hypothetical protein